MTPNDASLAEPPKPELLAPAGSIEVFFAALEEGADAVYVGTPQFNARMRAKNFSFDELARMIAYAHKIGRKLYITLNTLIKEAELPQLVKTLDTLRRMAPDALIIQDWGVFQLARELAPELPLHASTQMTLHNLSGVLQAERLGFERVILARELTLEEIAFIRRNTSIELESFIHGAMCYSISGQCNFSSYAHGKSANRGQCLQPCRRLYDVGETRSPLFAPRDLGAAPILAQLIKCGIRCFKIEGRLKPAETIAQIVGAYRLLIDAHPRITAEVVQEARERLRLAIGRKQSTGFYLQAQPHDGRIGDGMSRSGLFLGRAQAVRPDSVEVQSREIIKVGDRVSVQKSRQEAPKNFKITRLTLGDKPIRRSRPNQVVRIGTPFPIAEGTGIVKQIDADATPSGARQHEEKQWPKARARSRMLLEATLTYTYEGAIRLESRLHNQALTLETWPSFSEQQEEETTRTVLEEETAAPLRLRLTALEGVEAGTPMTLPELRELRDALLAEATQRLDQHREETLIALRRGLTGHPPSGEKAEYLVYVKKARDIGPILKRPEHSAVLSLLRANDTELAALHEAQETRERLIWALPDFAFNPEERTEIQARLKQLVHLGARRFLISNPGHFSLLRNFQRRRLEIFAGDPFHAMNSAACAALLAQGAHKLLYALEGDQENLQDLCEAVGASSLVVTLFGKVPLFRSRQPWPDHTREALCVVDSREKLHIRRLDNLTYVTPERDFSIRHHLERLQGWGVRSFLYDLRHSFYADRDLDKLLGPRYKLDPRRETDMNFSRGLE